MPSENGLRELNLKAIFAILDTDGDGFISEDDFAAMAKRFTDEFEVTGDAPGVAVDAAFLAWWERLRADYDSDGDGRVGLAEFTAAFVSGGGNPEAYYQQLLGPVLEVVGQTMDVDGDGFIDTAEYVRALTVHGLDGGSAATAFARLDDDGDGKINTAEFLAGIRHAFLSQDRADPGTELLGNA
jgi:Ca2+-binding EF-hand superfamily protein